MIVAKVEISRPAIERWSLGIHTSAIKNRAATAGKDPVVDDASNECDESRKYTEFPAVAHLEELRHCERSGFPEAVDHPSGKRNDDERRALHKPPPDRGEGDVVVLLPEPDQRNDTELGHPVRNCDQVPPGATLSSQEP